jgi:hypothetical protein
MAREKPLEFVAARLGRRKRRVEQCPKRLQAGALPVCGDGQQSIGRIASALPIASARDEWRRSSFFSTTGSRTFPVPGVQTPSIKMAAWCIVSGTSRVGQTCEGLIVDKRRGIDALFGGPGELLFARKAAAMRFAAGGVVATARPIHTGKHNATVLRASCRQRHANRGDKKRHRCGSHKAAAQTTEHLLVIPSKAHCRSGSIKCRQSLSITTQAKRITARISPVKRRGEQAMS